MPTRWAVEAPYLARCLGKLMHICSFFTMVRGALLLWLLLWASLSSARPAAPIGRAPPLGSGSASERLPADAPLSTPAWVAHGALALVPLGGAYAASRVGDERLWVAGAQVGAGMVAGWLPSGLLFLRAQAAGPRWTELEVSVFGAGLVLTPPLAALGTWALGEWAFHGSQDRGNALLGAMGGAAVGTLLGVVAHAALERLAAPGSRLQELRRIIALGFVGAGATAGYQWAGGGPSPYP